MKMSIRTKLFIILSGLMIFFVFLSLALTNLCLEKFYIWQKKDILITRSKQIDDVYNGTPEEISLELEKISNTLGAGILIFSDDGKIIKYSSFGPIFNKKFPNRFLPHPSNGNVSNSSEEEKPFSVLPPGPPHLLKSSEVIDSRTVLQMHQDLDLKIDFIILEYQLNNNDLLIIRQPLAPISESATLTIQFMIFTAILSIIVGGIWAFFFAKKFTHPIFELNRIAQGMAKLDFSQKCMIDYSDEFGELGKNINHLSDQLDAAITELNQKNRQLMADVEKERKLDKMRKEFVSNVSHELKTPLSLILGYAEGLKENVVQDEDNKNYYCSVIIDEAEKMDKLVKSLLNLSQIESGVFELNRTDFNLTALIRDIALKYRTVLQEKGITLTIDMTDNKFVNGDELRIEQILLNLLNNAINHAEQEKIITIKAMDHDEHVRVCVFNTGRNIPADSLEKLWTSFYKVDKARTREYGGYGLGLSIVRAIQELHDNGYGVENKPNGVTFWFELDKVNSTL